jgi:hypothetical protein
VVIAELDGEDEAVHEFRGNADLLYIKLKSSNAYDRVPKALPYNQPAFFNHLFGGGEFAFNPQFSTAKLDYDFAEHRNLSELGAHVVEANRATIRRFVNRAR